MNPYKLFAAYAAPSVLAFALSGVYAIVDGFFVGHSMGDAGLSAINIAYPSYGQFDGGVRALWPPADM